MAARSSVAGGGNLDHKRIAKRLPFGPSAKGVGDEEIVRIKFETQPAIVACVLKDRRHAVVDLAHQLIGRHRNDREGSRFWIAPILPQSR
jgi:hypothetical protein